MKLHRLELEGFGPFRDRQVVDFDGFADDGIFLITGRTGAGKSSILDGVCFALYGGVPRYEAGDKRVRSDYCEPDDPSEALLEFTAHDRRWRVTRTPEYERPKKRGTGMTRVGADAKLAEWVAHAHSAGSGAGDWIGRAAGPRDVGLLLDDVLGLSQQQFLQVILLAQGRFSQFLLAKNDERQKVLRTLFGTKTYEDYERLLEEKRKSAEHALALDGDRLLQVLIEAEALLLANAIEEQTGANTRDSAGMDDADRVAIVAAASHTVAQRARVSREHRDHAKKERDEAERRRAEHIAINEAQERRTQALQALARLEELAPAMADKRTMAEAALRAEPLRTVIEAAATAEGRESAAALAVARAQEGWADLGETHTEVARLTAVIDALSGDIAVAEAAREIEEALEGDAADHTALQHRHDVLVQKQKDASSEHEECAEQLRAGEEPLRAAAHDAAILDAATTARTTAQSRLMAAREAAQHAQKLEEAEASYARANAAAQEGGAAVGALLQKRLEGYATELASQLVEAQPCAVCGSTSHPAPATLAPTNDVIVTAETIADAEAEHDQLRRRETHAAQAARTAREAHAAIAARAGGESVESLESALIEAQIAYEQAEQAAAVRERLSRERDQLVRRRDDLDVALSETESTLAALRAEIAVSAERRDRRRADVDAARGQYETVQFRLDALTGQRAAARTLVEASEEHDRCREIATDARRKRDERIVEDGFVDVTGVRVALRDAATRAQWARELADHDVAVRTESDRVREADKVLAEVPGGEGALDLASATAALESATVRWTAAVEEAAHMAELDDRLGALAERATVMQTQRGDAEAAHAVIARLAHAVSGREPNTLRMTLETFVLAAQLEEIVIAANVRLHAMSAGRYSLQHTDALARRKAASGLGLEVFDAHTGQSRPPQSLSGGETFLASLALALGLAEVVTAQAGGLRLDTLFIDEGFGSLDAETLETAMRTLDELRAGGRTVGVISHVEAMKEQLAAQLVVEAGSRGPSSLRRRLGE